MHKNINKVGERDIAIIFIHGILGTPNHFNDFIKLTPEDISIYNILLDGHGGNTKDFSNTSMRKWKRQVKSKFNEACFYHKEVMIVAHSMGTLFAMELAQENRNKVSDLFLLAPPMKPILKPYMLILTNKILNNKINDIRTCKTIESCGISLDKHFFEYIKWIPNYISLFNEIHKTRKKVYKIKTPTLVFMSKKDELVLMSSQNYFKDNKNITVYKLPKSTHFYYENKDKNIILNEYKKLICKITKKDLQR